eukprot:5162408-Pleurochrysis_carterae.AAC.2
MDRRLLFVSPSISSILSHGNVADHTHGTFHTDLKTGSDGLYLRETHSFGQSNLVLDLYYVIWILPHPHHSLDAGA